MMRSLSSTKAEWPEVGELVVATVKTVTNYGAYVALDEYGKEGLLHISEISSTWVKNIRDFVREKQKVVLKVLRVNAKKGQVDLSLRRVSRQERQEKIRLWKKDKRAESLLHDVSEELNMSLEEINAKAGVPIQEKFGELYKGLEKTAKEGATVLTELGIPEHIAVTLERIAKERIRIQMVKKTGLLEIACTKPDGAIAVRNALLQAQKLKRPKGSEVHIYTVSPPSYRVEVLAEDYKKAEALLQKTADIAVQTITKFGGRGAFRSEK
jgi:translation initiation factor 2 subunit 1